MQRSLTGLFLLALTIGLLALAGGSLRTALQARMGRENKARPAQERIFGVNVVRATRVTATPKITAFGEIRSRRTLDIRAPVSGTVARLSANFVDGGVVSKGDVLLRLDPSDAQSALDVARTDQTEAGNELTEAKAALLLARDELASARAQVVLRLKALNRQRNLRARGVSTDAAVEAAALARAAAGQAVLGKRGALAQAQTRINRAKTSLSRREIRVNEAARRLADTEVLAEFDGVLSAVQVVKGGQVGVNEKIGRLIDPSALEVVFRLSNSQFAGLIAANGNKAVGAVTVRLDSMAADQIASGEIVRVSGEVGAGQTGRQVFATLTRDGAPSLRPGDFVTVNVSEPPLANVVVLPATAVSANSSVLVLGDNNRLSELPVTIVRKQGNNVILRGEGLFGREVVAVRSPLLGAGIRVKPVRRDVFGRAFAPTEMMALTAERRARLVAFVEGSKSLPAAAKDRILSRLSDKKVPVEMVNRIESRMGG